MEQLFQIVNNELVPSIHALMIEPYKSIWENDDTENKEYAKKVFMYVELLCNPRKSNPFSGYSEQVRPAKVKKKVYGSETPDISKEEKQDIIYCVQEYKQMLEDSSPSYGLYVDAGIALHKLRTFLRGFNYEERTNSGGLVLKPKDMTMALSQVDTVDKSLQMQRERVHAELTETSKTRKDREIGIFER